MCARRGWRGLFSDGRGGLAGLARARAVARTMTATAMRRVPVRAGLVIRSQTLVRPIEKPANCPVQGLAPVGDARDLASEDCRVESVDKRNRQASAANDSVGIRHAARLAQSLLNTQGGYTRAGIPRFPESDPESESLARGCGSLPQSLARCGSLPRLPVTLFVTPARLFRDAHHTFPRASIVPGETFPRADKRDSRINDLGGGVIFPKLFAFESGSDSRPSDSDYGEVAAKKSTPLAKSTESFMLHFSTRGVWPLAFSLLA